MAKYTNLTKDERDAYNKSLKHKWDNKNVMDYAVEQGIKQERANNEKEKRETAVQLAYDMLADGETLEKIAKYTKLSIQEIEEL